MKSSDSSQSSSLNCKKCGQVRYSRKHDCIADLSFTVNEQLSKIDKEVTKKLRDYRYGPSKAVKTAITERCTMWNYFAPGNRSVEREMIATRFNPEQQNELNQLANVEFDSPYY